MLRNEQIQAPSEQVESTPGSFELPSLSVPKGGGALQGLDGKAQVDGFTGSAGFSVPFDLTPARGLEPAVALSYSSGSGQGVFGLGISMDAPRISRRTSKGIPRYDDHDIFILSGQGELVEVSRERQGAQTVIRYQPRSEGDFSRIEQVIAGDGCSFWQVQDGSNSWHRYGIDDDSRIADCGHRSHIFEWLLSDVVDERGNRIQYDYKPENREGIPVPLGDSGRDHANQRYLSSIRYGNYVIDGVEHYAFRVVFDYGEYTLDDPEERAGCWSVRPDPFSRYNAGFEIRTHRLCRHILQYHHLVDENDGQPFLVRGWKLDYTTTDRSNISRLAQLQSFGCRKDGSGVYQFQWLPPTTLRYSEPEPAGRTFDPLQVGDGKSVVNNALLGHAQWVDLYSEGLPGLLLVTEQDVLYARPEGQGQFGVPVEPEAFPIEKPVFEGRASLADVRGDGQLSVVVGDTVEGGYYPGCRGETLRSNHWDSYRTFTAYTADYADRQSAQVDVSGNGRADLLVYKEDSLLRYPNRGAEGYGQPEPHTYPPGWQHSETDSGQVKLGYAALFGDGLSHRVAIKSGEVKAWPCLGYGRFGSPVLLSGAPDFGADFDPNRLHLVDIDGSGTADLLYVRDNHIEIYHNQNGNGFARGDDLPLPRPYSQLSQVQVTDVLGQGTSSVVLIDPESDVVGTYYDLNGGQKPHLLTETDNHQGLITRLFYDTSTTQYLRDQHRGNPWQSKIPFPVQVVKRVETEDQVTGTLLVQRYAYHEGHYDTDERLFRGFGYVEQWDGEEVGKGISKGTDVPPIYTKSWYHTGHIVSPRHVTRHYEKHYYNKDPRAYALPDSVIELPLHQRGDPLRTRRNSYTALSGQLLRTEVYSPDGSACEQHPYTVSESNYTVRCLKAAPGADPDEDYGIFQVLARESQAYQYERNPEDPRRSHSLVLKHDEYGFPRQTAEVAYGRRSSVIVTDDPVRKLYPEQQQLRIVLQTQSFVHQTDDIRLLGIPVESGNYELAGLPLPLDTDDNDSAFTIDGLRTQIASLAEITYTDTFSGQPEKQLINRSQSYYWDKEQQNDLPLGRVDSPLLPHHEETAVMTDNLASQVYNKQLTDADIEQGGYRHDPSQQLWWAIGPTTHYLDQRQFYQGYRQTDPFGADSRVDYDSYMLSVVQSKEIITDPLNGESITRTSRAEPDYYTLSPWRMTDPTGTVTEVHYDALGQVVVYSTHGSVAGKPEGYAPVSDYQPIMVDDDIAVVIAEPERYLQGCGGYFYYDHWAWARRQQPLAAISLEATDYVQRLKGVAGDEVATGTEPRIKLSYQDGLGRIIQTKVLTMCGEAFLFNDQGHVQRDDEGQPERGISERRYIVSGAQLYNNKGEVVESWLPYYSNQWVYERDQYALSCEVLPKPTVTYHDPLSRVKAMETAKGFWQATDWSPWYSQYHDEIDTLADSRYYQQVMKGELNVDAQELQALQQSTVLMKTPVSQVLDNLGRMFITLEQQVSVVEPDTQYLAQHLELDIQGRATRQWDARLNATGQAANFTQRFPLTGEDPLQVHSTDGGEQIRFTDSRGLIVRSWNSRQVEEQRTYDNTGRLCCVEICGGDEQTGELSHRTEVCEYGDFHEHAASHNLYGQLYRRRDQAGETRQPVYNIAGQPLEEHYQLRINDDREPDWNQNEPLESEIFTTRISYNALGDVIEKQAVEGSIQRTTYNVAGQLQQLTLEQDGPRTTVIDNLLYNAEGQRLCIRYGNGIETRYGYERSTLRLESLTSADAQGTPRQALDYTYDPVGNITTVIDNSIDTVFHARQQIKPVTHYTYDSRYQLIETRGRQHKGIHSTRDPARYRDETPVEITLKKNDGQCLEHYRQQYRYDEAGNLISLSHQAQSQSFRRDYAIATGSNRSLLLDDTSTSSSATRQAIAKDIEKHYDAAGNLRRVDHLHQLHWDYRNQLQRVTLVERETSTDDLEYYVYGSDRQRIKKVSQQQSTEGIIYRQETLYLGDTVISRRYQLNQKSGDIKKVLQQQRTRLTVSDGKDNVLTLETLEEHTGKSQTNNTLWRYQLSNILSSATTELDEQGQLISYEEYYPYGETSLSAGRSRIEVESKLYRYSGKEKDNTTGLYYYGARYYAPWLGRWLNPDPAGTVDGLNLYVFVSGNPVSFYDQGGNQGKTFIYQPFKAAFIDKDVVSSAAGFNAVKTRRLESPATFVFRDSAALQRFETLRSDRIKEEEADIKALNTEISALLQQESSIKNNPSIDPAEATKRLSKITADIDLGIKLKVGAQENIYALKNTPAVSNEANVGQTVLSGLDPANDSLYIDGHGAPGGLYITAQTGDTSKPDALNRVVMVSDLALQLKQSGLSKNTQNVHCLSCYAASTSKPKDFTKESLAAAGELEVEETGFFTKLLSGEKIKKQPFAQALASALGAIGFNKISVSGSQAAVSVYPKEAEFTVALDINGKREIMPAANYQRSFKPL